MTSQFIYEFTGWFSPRIYKHEIVVERPKTYLIARNGSRHTYRLHKNKVEQKEWDGGFYSFDLQKILLAAHEGILRYEKEYKDKMENIKKDLEQYKNDATT